MENLPHLSTLSHAFKQGWRICWLSFPRASNYILPDSPGSCPRKYGSTRTPRREWRTIQHTPRTPPRMRGTVPTQLPGNSPSDEEPRQPWLNRSSHNRESNEHMRATAPPHLRLHKHRHTKGRRVRILPRRGERQFANRLRSRGRPGVGAREVWIHGQSFYNI